MSKSVGFSPPQGMQSAGGLAYWVQKMHAMSVCARAKEYQPGNLQTEERDTALRSIQTHTHINTKYMYIIG